MYGQNFVTLGACNSQYKARSKLFWVHLTLTPSIYLQTDIFFALDSFIENNEEKVYHVTAHIYVVAKIIKLRIIKKSEQVLT